MNNLIKLILRFSDVILFIVLEGVSVALIANNSFYQQTQIYSMLQQTQNYFFVNAGRVVDYVSLRQDNERLAVENTKLRNQLYAYQSRDTLQNRQFTNYQGARYNYYPAKLANINIHKQHNYMSLNIGEENHVHRDMGVVANNCVAGIVINTSAHFATVMSVLNRDFKISARLKKSKHLGSLTWDGIYYRETMLTEVPQHATVMPGDTVETSGYSGMFPEGILIGTVVASEIKRGSFLDIRVRLAIDFNTLRYVEVIDNTLQIEQRFMEAKQ
jgi:rod shape-determining protein MreC